MVDPELLEILVCPETKQQLQQADADLLNRLNLAIQSGQVVNRGGHKLADRVEEGLIRKDGMVLYVVQEDIPIMLLDEAIEVQDLF
tara:strand:- start:4381 stop:4638 length:258 start_codon:yes stop_codon:yes gene_type:complete